MILPYRSEVEIVRRPVVSQALMMANVLVFLYTSSFDEKGLETFFYAWGFIPFDWTLKTLFAHMFLHANGLHLLGNMLFLWIFGPPVEDRLGPLVFSACYVIFGFASAFGHAAGVAGSMIDDPAVGSSGAISGLIGIFTVFYPRAWIRHVAIVVVRPVFFSLPAWLVMGLWLAEQFLLGFYASAINVAIFGHLGGCFAGIVAGKLLESRFVGASAEKEISETGARPALASLFADEADSAAAWTALAPVAPVGDAVASEVNWRLARVFAACRAGVYAPAVAACENLAPRPAQFARLDGCRIAMVKDRLGLSREHPEEILQLADGLSSGSGWKEAFALYEELLEKAPDHPRRRATLLWLGETLVNRMNRPEDARPYLKEAAEGEPRSPLVQEARFLLKKIGDPVESAL
jgi:membrane associated rhomboid family serine protease